MISLLHGGKINGEAALSMMSRNWDRLRRAADRFLPERQVYVKVGEGWWTAIFSTRAQLVGASVSAMLVLGAVVGLGASVLERRGGEQAQARTDTARIAARRAHAETSARLAALRDESIRRLASEVERRHAALAMLVGQIDHEGTQADAPRPTLDGDALARMTAVRQGQDSLLARTDAYAKARGERLRLALRLAGLNPASSLRGGPAAAMGGPLIDARDPRALSAVLDVDVPFAARIQHAALGLGADAALSSVLADLPLGFPVADPVKSSGFGVRSDPFTGAAAFHAGQDFSGRLMAAVSATGPGVVSFVGQRTGYGNTVEIDHGRGFKTRYAHLAAAVVHPGQKVALGQHIGAMGSTGRSTGVHLHYEVWVAGRVQDPNRYLRAGEYVHANG